jgi:hypothetical protein
LGRAGEGLHQALAVFSALQHPTKFENRLPGTTFYIQQVTGGDAAELRSRSAIAAGVDYLATDQYKALAEIVHARDAKGFRAHHSSTAAGDPGFPVR